MKIKFLLILSFSLLIISCGGGSTSNNRIKVNDTSFKDSGCSLSTTLGNGLAVYVDEVVHIGCYHYRSDGTKISLESLSLFTNLETLDISLFDINQGPLREVDYSGDPTVGSLDGLAKLKKLKTLTINENYSETNPDTWEQLNIENLHVSTPKILPHLNKIKSIKRLSIAATFFDFEKIKDLSNLSNLQGLSIAFRTNISNISFINNLESLTELSIVYHSPEATEPVIDGEGKVFGFGLLNYLPSLKEIRLHNAWLDDLSSLENFYSLEVFNSILGHVHESGLNISSLKCASNLKKIQLAANGIKILSIDESCKEIEFLNLTANDINDISGLKNFDNLNSLLLDNNQINDIAPLSGLLNLKSLYLSANKIQNISPIKNLHNLTRLDLGGNEIEDIIMLPNLLNLEALSLNSNSINDISPLFNMTKLRKLNLRPNDVSESDIQALEDALSIRVDSVD